MFSSCTYVSVNLIIWATAFELPLDRTSYSCQCAPTEQELNLRSKPRRMPPCYHHRALCYHYKRMLLDSCIIVLNLLAYFHSACLCGVQSPYWDTVHVLALRCAVNCSPSQWPNCGSRGRLSHYRSACSVSRENRRQNL